MSRRRKSDETGANGGETGQATVEFALILPLILIVLLGLVSLGKAFTYWIDQTHLASEAARYAAVDKKPDGTQTISQYLTNEATSRKLRPSTNKSRS